jgi:predicted RNA binding protein YcfA (HicA-like mRNA interferase family)
MPKAPRLDAAQAERLLKSAGFVFVRSSGSHRIYMRGTTRFVVPFHAGKTLHPKIIRDLLNLVSSSQ